MMNKQGSEIGNIVRSVVLIAIGIVLGVGISIGIGIARIGDAPSRVSQRVDQFDRQAVLRDFGSRAVHVERLDAAAVDRAAKVVRVKSNYVHYGSFLV